MEGINLLRLFLIINTLNTAFAVTLVLKFEAINLGSRTPGGRVYMRIGITDRHNTGYITDFTEYQDNVEWTGLYEIKDLAKSDQLNFRIWQISNDGTKIDLGRTFESVSKFMGNGSVSMWNAEISGSILKATPVLIRDGSSLTWEGEKFTKVQGV